MLGRVFGAQALARQRRRDAGIVLLYHRVSLLQDRAYAPISPEAFQEHCRFIASNFDVVTLAEIVERLRSGRSLAGTCAITFDDGYRDFIEYALPVLAHFRFPVTHFLLADAVRSGAAVWTYRARLIATAAHNPPKLPMGELEAMRRSVREQWLDEKERETRELPALPAMLRAADLDRIDRTLVEWGSHTLSHAMLDRVPPDEARVEISESKRELEAIVGRPIRFLAYPNGRSNGVVEEFAREAGYEAAFAVGQVEIGGGAPMFALPRVDVGAIPLPMLSLEVSGVTERVRRLRARLAARVAARTP